ncbi:MAG: acetate/propionate family kinase, partial [Acidimicrobiia bacterium]
MLADRTIDRWKEGDAESVAELLQGLNGFDGIGHRVVHGGASFREAIRIDDQVLDQIAEFTPLAPLHQPRALAGIKAVRAALPEIPSVACFDTSFHARMPARSAEYALPEVWRKRWKLRRYGFHGLSHGYAARRAATMLARSVSKLRIVTCHLGAGASLAAVENGHSIDTTMGF